jgi:hypothetical protein
MEAMPTLTYEMGEAAYLALQMEAAVTLQLQPASSFTHDASNADLPWPGADSPDWGRVIAVRRTNPLGRFRPDPETSITRVTGVHVRCGMSLRGMAALGSLSG